jgi:hypothetical protein
MANIELDGTNKKIKVDSGDLTLDVPGDIILDADGADLVFADGGTNILKVTNSSSDVVFQPQVDAKDIIFKQYDGTTVATVEDNGTFNVPTSKLAINGTAITSTAAELNLLDGGTSVGGSITLADADGIVTNDGGTMKTIPASDIKTYAGFTATTITGTTALAAQPASDDEIIISDGGTLKRLDIKHIQNTPAFHVEKSGAQSIANATTTKLTFDTELYDSDGTFGSDKFTPGVAGKYMLVLNVMMVNAGDGKYNQVYIYKNGSEFNSAPMHLTGNGSDATQDVFAGFAYTVIADDDDYFECYIRHNHGSNLNTGTGQRCYFLGYRISGV